MTQAESSKPDLAKSAPSNSAAGKHVKAGPDLDNSSGSDQAGAHVASSPGATIGGPAQSDEVVLKATDLVKHFPLTRGIVFQRTIGQVQAVDGVSFDLRRGETLGVVGESGCGKTTLSRVILGLEKATSGSLEILGNETVGIKEKERRRLRRKVQIVFQDPYASLDPRMTVGKIVGEPFAIHTEVAPRGDRRSKVKELLDVVGLNPEHINRYPHQFSGGQRQRIGIARALALRPEIIVCDEPVSALDVSVQAQVMNLLESLQTEFNLSYIFIAHDLSVVRHIADRTAVMYLGRIVEIGTEKEIYDNPTHPYTQALLSAAPVPNPELRGQREQIVLVGDVPSPANPPSGCRFRTRCWKAQDICAESEPLLQVRDGSPHPSACHFAEERDIIHAQG